MSALIVEDEVVHYEVLGRGRPLIFVHGWLGSWRYWIPTMQALSSEYRTYALDLWGFGDSATPPSYATVSMFGTTGYTWTPSTTDPRGQQLSTGTGRLASTYQVGPIPIVLFVRSDGVVSRVLPKARPGGEIHDEIAALAR